MASIGFNMVAGNPMSIDYGEDNTSWANQIFNVFWESEEPDTYGIFAPTGWIVEQTDVCEFSESK